MQDSEASIPHTHRNCCLRSSLLYFSVLHLPYRKSEHHFRLFHWTEHLQPADLIPDQFFPDHSCLDHFYPDRSCPDHFYQDRLCPNRLCLNCLLLSIPLLPPAMLQVPDLLLPDLHSHLPALPLLSVTLPAMPQRTLLYILTDLFLPVLPAFFPYRRPLRVHRLKIFVCAAVWRHPFRCHNIYWQ